MLPLKVAGVTARKTQAKDMMLRVDAESIWSPVGCAYGILPSTQEEIRLSKWSRHSSDPSIGLKMVLAYPHQHVLSLGFARSNVRDLEW